MHRLVVKREPGCEGRPGREVVGGVGEGEGECAEFGGEVGEGEVGPAASEVEEAEGEDVLVRVEG